MRRPVPSVGAAFFCLSIKFLREFAQYAANPALLY